MEHARRRHGGLAVVATAAIAPLLGAARPSEGPVVVPELELELVLPPLEGLAEPELVEGSQTLRKWTGKLGSAELSIDLARLDFEMGEPGDVAELAVDTLRRTRRFDVLVREFLTGPYGYAPFVALVEATIQDEGHTNVTGTQFVVGGLAQGSSYILHIECRPKPDDAARAGIREFLEKGIRYTGAERDPEWTLEEIEARWLRDAPEDLHEDFQKAIKRKSTRKKCIIRTEHYLILTNSFSGKKFGKKMEENYDEIVETFPFADVKGRKLMPVFLFRTPDNYYDFYRRISNLPEDDRSVERSKGHAWRDYYATWYEAPGDPVHIHEQVHQIFKNRLRLSGGGSWFQEGVAEYIESSENDRNAIASVVRRQRHVPLPEFFQLQSLLYSSASNQAGDAYKQAALLIEFLHESDFGKKGFEDFLLGIGEVPRGDLEAIEGVLRRVYGVSAAELDVAFQAYCEKR